MNTEKIELQSIRTRFRAYQLGNAGSSFSYFADDHFTLIEGRLTENSRSSLADELKECGKTRIDTLHITSWDMDHCSFKELQEILETLHPSKIEYPGYVHDSENYRNCLGAINEYKAKRIKASRRMTAQRIDPPYVNSLKGSTAIGYKDIIYHPREDYANSNDNSIVKLYRGGMFNVASLGDIEHPNIGSMLRGSRKFKNEVDILILAHHGANNDINSRKFFETVRPTVAICSADYNNKYGHINDEVRGALHKADIPLFTTKTGDVLIESILNHRKEYRVTNFKANTTEISSQYDFVSKKFHLLRMNDDTVRNRFLRKPTWPK
ncbi:hypothetical protein SJS38_20455 [Aeromonas dhakensis]|uniref:ComEC/Rec2 family competence protein n=1 Tax=Aeromonas dhakensis TaxID=196024 RepID=UPI0029D8BFB6|nr:hypothetical protein [Aeromonas dhakensis]MDX7698323.1 hypothetical protein [Aeromonas dhakensis]